MPRITKENPITNYVSQCELNRIQNGIREAITAQKNQKLARIQLVDALNTVLDAFENGALDKEVDAEFPRGSVYGIVKAAVARIQEARL